MRALLLSLLLLAPGCIGVEPEDAGPDVVDPGETPPTPRLDRRGDCPVPQARTAGVAVSLSPTVTKDPCTGEWTCRSCDEPFGLDAPVLPVGRAWTYQATQLYNPDAEFRVVVAEAGPKGYRFAGGAEDDLVYHALWGSGWHGEHGLDLNAGLYALRTFDFPLFDGKSWDFREGLRLTARSAEVATPSGREQGFVVEGADDRVRLRYEYAHSVGYLVSFLTEIDGKVHEELRLTRVEDGVGEWFWYELGPLVVVPQPHEPQAFEVPAGYDHVLLSAGGTNGGRALVAGQGGVVWQAEFTGEERWDHAMLPATEGRWTGSVQGRPFLDLPVPPPAPPPVGWAYMHLAPVKWVHHME